MKSRHLSINTVNTRSTKWRRLTNHSENHSNLSRPIPSTTRFHTNSLYTMFTFTMYRDFPVDSSPTACNTFYMYTLTTATLSLVRRHSLLYAWSHLSLQLSGSSHHCCLRAEIRVSSLRTATVNTAPCLGAYVYTTICTDGIRCAQHRSRTRIPRITRIRRRPIVHSTTAVLQSCTALLYIRHNTSFAVHALYVHAPCVKRTELVDW